MERDRSAAREELIPPLGPLPARPKRAVDLEAHLRFVDEVLALFGAPPRAPKTPYRKMRI